MAKVVFLVALIALIAWFIFGNPSRSIANVLWANSAAPWENVIGFYYPDSTDHASGVKTQDSGTLSQCREWAQVTIAASVDPEGRSSGYTCGIGCTKADDADTCRVRMQ